MWMVFLDRNTFPTSIFPVPHYIILPVHVLLQFSDTLARKTFSICGGLVAKLCPTLQPACHWSGLPFPSAGSLPGQGIEPRSLAVQVDSLPTEIQGKPLSRNTTVKEATVQSLSLVWLCDPHGLHHARLPCPLPTARAYSNSCLQVCDAIQPCHPLSSSSPPVFSLSPNQGLFQWVSSSHQVAKVLEFQLQHQSFQWTPRTDLL